MYTYFNGRYLYSSKEFYHKPNGIFIPKKSMKVKNKKKKRK